MEKKRRVLWLINHKSLMKFEVPLLLDLGYEVFVPKIFPMDIANMSAHVDYQYDKYLTIPKEELDVLNSVNFYEHIPMNCAEIMNAQFDICITHFFLRQMKELFKKYANIIILRAFGLSDSLSYESILYSYEMNFKILLEGVKDRLFFGQGYNHLHLIEGELFYNRSVYLPIGMKNAAVNDSWKGTKERIMFVCPQIAVNHISKDIFDDFIKHFSEYDYIVGGGQAIIVNDENVAGFMSDDEYNDAYENSRFMYYHSTHKNHIHYHPFEAVQKGLPLLFMGGGMLDNLGGKKLPGRCKDINEAKKKAARLMRGDKKLIDRIRESQPILLEKMKCEYCRPIWEENLGKIERAILTPSIVKQKHKKRIAVVLSAEYLGGVLDYTIRLLYALEEGRKNIGGDIEFVFAFVKHPNFEEGDPLKEIREMGIPMRSFIFEPIDYHRAKSIISTRIGKEGVSALPNHNIYYLLNDGMNYFHDCDYLIFTCDRVSFPILNLIPHVVCVHDCLQRYIPEHININSFNSVCFANQSDDVIVTTPFTRDDCINYVGLPKYKVKQVPYLIGAFNGVSECDIERKPKKLKPYFLWSTNTAPHKNHKIVLRALSEYYQTGGKLRCHVTGVNTHLFDPNVEFNGQGQSYLESIRDEIRGETAFKKMLFFRGNLTKSAYASLLKGSRFLLHACIVDNGAFSVVDAAMLGLPSVSSRYPAMEYMDSTMGLNLKFFDPHDEKDLLAILRMAEKESEQWKEDVPSSNTLSHFTVDATYPKIYEVFRDIIGF